LREGSECLELGEGKGDIALRTVEDYRPVRGVATDYDPEQVAAARRFLAAAYPDGLPPALELRTADALRLDFPDGSFDAVFATQAGPQSRPVDRPKFLPRNGAACLPRIAPSSGGGAVLANTVPAA